MKAAIILFFTSFVFIFKVHAGESLPAEQKAEIAEKYARYYAEFKQRQERAKPKEKNGPVTFHYEDGKIKEQQFFEHSKPHGEWKSYWENGNLKSVKHYKEGELQGPYQKYFKNGQLQEEGFYEGGVLDGLRKTYYDNGQLSSEVTFTAAPLNVLVNQYKLSALANGPYKTYYKNGQLESEGFYVDSKKDRLCKTYYKNGQLKSEIIYKGGKYNGVGKEYYKNGALKTEWDATNTSIITPLEIDEGGTGWFKSYSDYGALTYSGQYVNGKRDGEWYDGPDIRLGGSKTLYRNGEVIEACVGECD